MLAERGCRNTDLPREIRISQMGSAPIAQVGISATARNASGFI
tara:strand:- start:552 stop:680 length:129 start_codon:yes stop_codon:yes gene_type:complete